LKKKYIFAKIMDYTFFNDLCIRILNIFFGTNYIRAINYHDTHEKDSNNFEQQLKFYKKHFSPVSIQDLQQFFDNGIWHKKKPGLIISFDDGFRTNYKIAKPLLEKYGFIGWFFIPCGFIDIKPEKQSHFAKHHNISSTSHYDSSKRIAMSWDELKDLSVKHVIGSHTFTHHRMNIKDSDDILKKEIINSKLLIEKKLNSEVDIFCWVGGEEHTYTKKAAKYIDKAGYSYSFMTNTYPITKKTDSLQLQRTNIESFFPLEVVKFQLCGMLDLYYSFKRYRVNRITKLIQS
tara:strand:- start:214 stop:1083 length:870 start_codon:yes stop_codon:yes gene_type:complete